MQTRYKIGLGPGLSLGLSLHSAVCILYRTIKQCVEQLDGQILVCGFNLFFFSLFLFSSLCHCFSCSHDRDGILLYSVFSSLCVSVEIKVQLKLQL